MAKQYKDRPWASMSREEKDRRNRWVSAYRKRNKEKETARKRQWLDSPEGKAWQVEYATKNAQRIRDRKRDGLRNKLIIRDGEICTYCRITREEYIKLIPNAKWHTDHVIPKSIGGSNEIGNRALTCQFCNMAKLDLDASVFRKWLDWITLKS